MVDEPYFDGYYGELTFGQVVNKTREACRFEIAAAARAGYEPSDNWPQRLSDNAEAARRIYNDAMRVAQKVAERAIKRQQRIAAAKLRTAGLRDFAAILETGGYDRVMF